MLVQLERQGGRSGSGQGGASYGEPVPDANGRVRATRARMAIGPSMRVAGEA